MILSKISQLLPTIQNALILPDQTPIQPGDLVVLTVRIIVPQLGIAELVSHEDHGGGGCQQKKGISISDLFETQFLDLSIIHRTFLAAVPAEVEIVSVPIVLTVRLIVLLTVGHQIV